MPLTCYCDHDGDYAWYYDAPTDYSTLSTTRCKRCSSCKSLIEIGSIVLIFPRWRYPVDDIEERIHGGDDAEITLAPRYLCEECADLWWSFDELGFECISPDESMRELAKQYAELYGPEKVAA